MTLKKILLLCFIPFLSYAQSEVYLDENEKPITPIAFKKKCESHIIKCLDYKTDSLTIHKMLYKYEFGKLNTSEFKQIHGLLTAQTKKTINPEATIILKFSDTLQSLQVLKANYEAHILTCSLPHLEKTIESFKSDRKKWVKGRKKCIKKFESKNDLNINYIYKYDNNALESYNDFEWIKDRGVFKNMFFNVMYANNLVVLKPNGEYFLSGAHLSDRSLSKLLSADDWTEFKSDWTSSTTTHLKKGKGFFNNGYINHKAHCF